MTGRKNHKSRHIIQYLLLYLLKCFEHVFIRRYFIRICSRSSWRYFVRRYRQSYQKILQVLFSASRQALAKKKKNQV